MSASRKKVFLSYHGRLLSGYHVRVIRSAQGRSETSLEEIAAASTQRFKHFLGRSQIADFCGLASLEW